MATNALCVGGANVLNASGLAYMPIPGNGVNAITTEANNSAPIQSGVTFSNFGINCRVQVGSSTIQFRVNVANANQAIAVTTSVNNFVSDSTHSDSPSAGNLVSFSYSTGSSLITPRWWQAQLNSSVPLAWYGMGAQAANRAFSASTLYVNVQGSTNQTNTTWNSDTQGRLEAPGTLSFLGMAVSTAPTGTVSVASYISGVNGNQALSFSSGTGFKQDVTHSDAVAANIDCGTNHSCSNASGAWQVITYQFAGTTSAHDCGSSTDTGIISSDPYYNVGGAFYWGGPTESQSTRTQPFACTLSLLRTNILAATNVTKTIKSRIATADGNQIISYAAQTGLMVDSTHTDSITAGQGLDFSVSAGSNVTSLFVTMDDGSVSGAHPKILGGMHG